MIENWKQMLTNTGVAKNCGISISWNTTEHEGMNYSYMQQREWTSASLCSVKAAIGKKNSINYVITMTHLKSES